MNNSIQTLPVDQLVGQTLGSCRVERLLGLGRLSAVFLAQQLVEKRPVAITAFIIPDKFSMQARERFISRFMKESAALVVLKHPHILPVYEYGEQYGYPYLVTPYVTTGSLADILKQQGRCTPAYTLEILEKIAAAIDYAHSKGVVHGTLKPSNILLNDGRVVQVAGYGLVRLLAISGIEKNDQPYMHLLSVAGTFLGSPEYIAPEFVEGQSLDTRSDIYALGIMLFELLSGRPPFTGTNPMQVAMQHVQQPLPSLHARYPDVSAALESVIFQALEKNPDHRFRHAGELATAFARAYTGPVSHTQYSAGTQAISAAEEEMTSTGKWQLMPPVVTGQLPSVNNPPADAPAAALAKNTGSWQLIPPVVTGSQPVVKPVAPSPVACGVDPDSPPVSLVKLKSNTGALSSPPSNLDDVAIDPFEFWSRTFSGQLDAPTPLAQADTRVDPLKSVPPSPARRPQSRSRGMSRRQVVALLAAGGVVTAGVLGFGGVSLAHMLGNMTHPQTATGTTSTTQGNGPAHGSTSATRNTPTSGKATPKATNKSNPTPTRPPVHTGTVIGSTNQGINSAKGFNNPVDGQGSLLIHLPNGNFVAYEKACTHEGVTVYYDANTRQLVCPAHGAIFDPANGGSVVQGPANRPLPTVTIRVNADGTITTG